MTCDFKFLYHVPYQELLSIPFHNHDAIEIVYYINGSGDLRLGNETYKYKPGDFTITTPKEFHNETHHELTEVIYINFLIDNVTFPIKTGFYSDPPSKLFYQIMAKLEFETTTRGYMYETKIEMLIQELLIEIQRLKEPKPLSNNWLSPSLAFIDEYYMQDINLTHLAKMSGYSYHRFRHLFKEATGLSPKAYILNHRFENIKKDLKYSSVNIQSLSYQHGFKSPAQFSALFKKHFGISPKEYRDKAF